MTNPYAKNDILDSHQPTEKALILRNFIQTTPLFSLDWFIFLFRTECMKKIHKYYFVIKVFKTVLPKWNLLVFPALGCTKSKDATSPRRTSVLEEGTTQALFTDVQAGLFRPDEMAASKRNKRPARWQQVSCSLKY